MTPLASRTAALLLVLTGLCQLANAQRNLIDRTYDPKTKTRLSVDLLIGQLPTSGYAPVRVTINNGTKFDRTWTFRFTSSDSRYGNDGNEVRSNFSAPCAAGRGLAFEFLVPVVTTFQSYSSSTTLEVVASAAAMSSDTGQMDTEFESAWPSIFLSDTLYKRNGSNLADEARKLISGGSSTIQFGGQFNPEKMSDDWRAYSGYDVCILTDDDWRNISPGARTALLQWNRMGGALRVYSTNPTTDHKALGITGAQRSWGTLEVRNIDSSLMLDGATTARMMISPPIRNRLKSLGEDYQTTWPLQVAFGAKTAHIVFFILVLIAFGILVGPVNLFVFAKSGQRHRLFITTPIISVGASLLLIVLIIFQDGFGGRGTRLILMEVRSDATENAAFISQEQIARTGVLFSTGFTTSEPGYLTPVLIGQSRWARVTEENEGGNSRYTLEVEESGLKAGGDWFQSRSEHGHLIETVRPTRGRIEMVTANPAPVITSTFEFPLETLYYLAPDGSFWLGENVLQGRNTKLTPVAVSRFDSWHATQRDQFAAQNRVRFDLVSTRLDHFVATSSEMSAVETLESIDWKETKAVITGPVINP